MSGMLITLEWTGSALRLLDQTRLPGDVAYVLIRDERQAWDAIKRLVVRGAPAIGVAAAYGACLGLSGLRGSAVDAMQRLNQVCDYLASSRPTAVNLFWALDRVRAAGARVGPDRTAEEVRAAALVEAQAIHREDQACCRQIGEHGLQFLLDLKRPQPLRLLTHCNAGALATSGMGTALAPVYVGLERGVRFRVYADETRPLLQGSRITACELSQAGVEVTVQCDNMAASLLSRGEVDAILVGADRIACNGDTANKIGTLGLAIIASHYRVPFLVLAPTSTIDRAIPDGGRIPIEHRDAREVTHPQGVAFAPEGVAVYNPAFDVTPRAMIAAIITEEGIWRPERVPARAPKARPPRPGG